MFAIVSEHLIVSLKVEEVYLKKINQFELSCIRA